MASDHSCKSCGEPCDCDAFVGDGEACEECDTCAYEWLEACLIINYFNEDDDDGE